MMFIGNIKFWDEIAETDKEEVMIIYGENFPEAIKEIGDYYGEDSIYKVSLEPIGDECNERMFFVNAAMAEYIKEANK